MNTPGRSSHIDFGKWAAVAFFAFVLTWNFMRARFLIKYFFPVNALKVLACVNHFLTAAFLVLIIYLYLRRRSAITTTTSYPARFVAVFALILPFALPFLGNPAPAGLVILAVSNVVMAAGLAFSLAALFALGKSFSIIPQTRNLVVQGPYRLVRHPIYLGEIILYFGVALAGVSVPKVIVVLLLVVCQVYRSIQEEKLLTDTFPEYLDYASKTARFLPGLF